MARKYRHLHPAREGDALLLAALFVGQLAPDIRKKFQGLEGDDPRNQNGLFETACEVDNNTGTIKESRIGNS